MIRIDHQAVSEARAVDAINEDALFYAEDDHQVTMLVADGASQRVKATTMQALVQGSEEPLTLAAYAARLTRDVVAQNRDLSPEDMLLKANVALGKAIKRLYGLPTDAELTPEAILEQEPDIKYREDIVKDPRLFRLLLPVCVATVAKINLQQRKLTFAHVGDTALFVFKKTARIEQITIDQMGPHDRRALAVTIGQSEAIAGKPPDMPVNVWNGIYHNFVDENGYTNPRQGVGVINGLPQLWDYVETSTVSLADVTGILVCSDGFIWPATWDEHPDDAWARRQRIRARIEREGVVRYLAALRQVERQDAACQMYPRFKRHDDATGLYGRLS